MEKFAVYGQKGAQPCEEGGEASNNNEHEDDR
jgi:hypothetical protein